MKLDSEFRQLIPPLANEEYQQLEQNIIDEGCRDALVTWNDILLDGHNRYEICTKNDIPFKTTSIELENRNTAKMWIIKNQFGRRNISNYSKGILVLKLEEVFSEKAKDKEFERKTTFPKSEKSNLEEFNTMKEIAKLAGIGHDNLARVKVIEREASPEQKEELVKKTKTINKVYREIRPLKPKEEVIEEAMKGGEEETKVCTTCGIRKSAAEFYNGKGECKACNNALRKINDPNAREELRAMNSHVVDGVDTIYEDMKRKTPSEEGTNKFIYNESISQLEDIVSEFNMAINQFLYMKSVFKGQTKPKELLKKAMSSLETIINLMEE